MHLPDLAVIRSKAKQLSIGAVLVLIAEFGLDLVKDRVHAWVNGKLDEEAGPALRVAAMIVKFATEHPIQTAIYIVCAYCAGVIVWAFVATLRSGQSKQKTIYQPIVASTAPFSGSLEVQHHPAPGLLPKLRRLRHRLSRIFRHR